MKVESLLLAVPALLLMACAEPQATTPRVDRVAMIDSGSELECGILARKRYLESARDRGLTLRGKGLETRVVAASVEDTRILKDLYARQLADLDACQGGNT